MGCCNERGIIFKNTKFHPYMFIPTLLPELLIFIFIVHHRKKSRPQKCSVCVVSFASRLQNAQLLGWDSWMLVEEHGTLCIFSAYNDLKFSVALAKFSLCRFSKRSQKGFHTTRKDELQYTVPTSYTSTTPVLIGHPCQSSDLRGHCPINDSFEDLHPQGHGLIIHQLKRQCVLNEYIEDFQDLFL